MIEVDAIGKDLDALIADTYRALVKQANAISPQWRAFYRPVIYCSPVIVGQTAKRDSKYIGIDGDVLEVISDERIQDNGEDTDLYIRFLEVAG